MIIGMHALIYSKKAAADRRFLRDVLGFPHVDAGGGWLIFALPAGEVGVHPGPKNDVNELYLMCDDVEGFVEEMEAKGVTCTKPAGQGWGVLTYVTMPGGGRLAVYEPRHPVAFARKARKKRKVAGAKKRQGAR